ncbi:YggS family pyridoxal phosphate-dependent enzyme [Polaribacter sp. AHE13PA]|jgi:pyridoxal phosphate enzyme (YggS family)|uniref:YggS family pyridoxal phosphate-dependent enzyme n=1 Tax=Polaribacter sp. AHE13PA TaxID=2745562 RepID=UPI001C4F0F27|nr:YggS family pyridoxal phosphate-dependent enzyme [Polaribacter sp. AHE13PA]QXP68482.1 YggS family pyridoxal phosphate-dependent enzyme [Polaribacter sp. AHE13PA]
MENIINNLKIIRNRMKYACEKTNRKPEDVRLLLATKTVGSERINFALQQGETLIGENKVQELKQKCNAVKELNPEIHFIGHLQSNKIKEVLKWASCIESIDRMSVAQKLQQRLVLEEKEIDVYIQVNTSFEESKFGISPDQTIELVKKVSKLKNIHIKGLMTIGLLSSDSTEIRKCFRLLKQLQEDIKTLNVPNVEMNELSMGMSGDLEIAIEEGATIIRVGTAVFGERIYPDSYYWNETKQDTE